MSPVNQAGERIAYSLEEDGSITMTVEIVYMGTDEQFAWILPVPVPPEVSPGTTAMFDALDSATTPTFRQAFRTDGTCRSVPRCEYPDHDSGGCGVGCTMGEAGPLSSDGGAADAAAAADGGALPDSGSITVYSEGAVGPYETVVLGATTADEVVTWLRDHDYDIPETTLPLLRPYADIGNVFVALRLSANRDSSQIRPITLHMATSEACLPIRLTAIATVPNMPITAYFLGSERVASTNYSVAEIDLTQARLYQGFPYTQEVTNVAAGLSGRAFATDFAGATPTISIELPSVLDLATETDIGLFLAEVLGRGYPNDTTLSSIVAGYVAPPVDSGIDAQTYVGCLLSFGGSTVGCGEPESFDPEGLAEAIDVELTQPRVEGQAMVDRHPQLTRLFTTMSAADMTVDPIFAERPGLPEVSNIHVRTTVAECSNEYYPFDAPRHIEVEGQVLPDYDGVRAPTDEAYCRRMGGHVYDSAHPHGGGCSTGAAGAQSFTILAALLVLVFRGRRRTWRA